MRRPQCENVDFYKLIISATLNPSTRQGFFGFQASRNPSLLFHIFTSIVSIPSEQIIYIEGTPIQFGPNGAQSSKYCIRVHLS